MMPVLLPLSIGIIPDFYRFLHGIVEYSAGKKEGMSGALSPNSAPSFPLERSDDLFSDRRYSSC
jgi:hypothetical protein